MNSRIYPKEFYTLYIENLNKIRAHKKFLEENTRRVIVEKFKKKKDINGISDMSLEAFSYTWGNILESREILNENDNCIGIITYETR